MEADTREERVLAVDFGDRRVGLALSDELGLTAQSLPTLEVNSLADAVRGVAEAARLARAARIVVGHPLLLSGERGARAVRTERFARELEAAAGIPVVLWDERLTTAEANRILHEGDAPRSRSVRSRPAHPRGERDRVAASLILAGYLERRRRERSAT